MPKEGRGVQSIEVGGRILQALVDAERPMMLRDLAKHAGVRPAQAHAYLVSYRKQSLVEQDNTAGRYRLGPFALQLGIARMRSFDRLRKAGDMLPELVEVIGFTVALAVWGTYGPTVIQIQEGTDNLYINTRVGTVYSLSRTATGRVFSAFLPEHKVKAALEAEALDGGKSRRVGNSEIYTNKGMREVINRVRHQGFASIEPPPIPGVSAISAPVFDHVGQIQMAVTVIGPKTLLDTSADSPTVKQLIYFAQRLSEQLGYEGGIYSALDLVDD